MLGLSGIEVWPKFVRALAISCGVTPKTARALDYNVTIKPINEAYESGDWHHDLPGERRTARARPTDGRACVSANNQTLRSDIGQRTRLHSSEVERIRL